MAAKRKIEDAFPWENKVEDNVFKYLTVIMVILFFIAAFIFNSAILPEPVRQSLKEVSPRLAQLVIEKKKEIKPKEIKKKLVPKKEKPKPKPKKKEEPIKEKPKPEKKKKPEPSAKEIAQISGLLAFADELSDLRDDFDLAELNEPIINLNANKKAKTRQNDTLTAKSTTTGSSGIRVSGRTRVAQKSLGQRKTAKVATSIKQVKLIKKDPKKKKQSLRSEEEIERVFQKNKGKIFTIYNRELRKDPSMKGKVVFAITIQPNGAVSQCIIVSSEIDNQKLQKRLISKIKKFKFKSLKVLAITVHYPIDFLPS